MQLSVKLSNTGCRIQVTSTLTKFDIQDKIESHRLNPFIAVTVFRRQNLTIDNSLFHS